MKLLFTLDEAGDDQLAELLGFSDASFKIVSLKGDLYNATDEIIELVGEDTYTSVLANYEAGNAGDDNAELLYRTQLAIALNAYRNFAPDNDVSHTSSGRIMRLGEFEKIPFEWQIDRSNKSLERKYYKAVDALLTFLDKNSDEWKETDAYKNSFGLFVRTSKDFDDYFDIGRSRLLLIKLLPGLRLAEHKDIKPRLGNELYKDIKDKLITSGDVDTELLEKIKEACVYKAIAWGLRRLSVQMFPEGVLQFRSERMTTQGKTPALNSEADAAAQRFDEDAAGALNDIEAILAAKNQPQYVELPPLTPYFNQDDNFLTTSLP